MNRRVSDIHVKRVYDAPHADDGQRLLVDRLWPRGIKKEALQLTAWLRDVAPSDELRRRFGHRPDLWDEFRAEYFAQLDERPEALQPLLEAVQHGRVTLLFATREVNYNNARALKEYIEARWEGGRTLPSGNYA